MITPSEIEAKEFRSALKGYNQKEVDEFLDQITLNMERLMAENEKLRREVSALSEDLKQFKKSESSVINTLESAKKLMSDISDSAEKRAEAILKNARLDAESIQRDAKDSISSLTDEGHKLKEKVNRFKARYKQLLEDELAHLEEDRRDLIIDLDKEFISDADENSKYEQKNTQKDTIVIKEKSIEEILMEDMNTGSDKNDMTKTKII